jgi:hypothetical protein
MFCCVSIYPEIEKDGGWKSSHRKGNPNGVSTSVESLFNGAARN